MIAQILGKGVWAGSMTAVVASGMSSVTLRRSSKMAPSI